MGSKTRVVKISPNVLTQNFHTLDVHVHMYTCTHCIVHLVIAKYLNKVYRSTIFAFFPYLS